MTNNDTLLDIPSSFRSLYWPVAIALAILLALLWFMGYGPGGRACLPSPVAMAPAPLPAAPAVAPVVAPVVAAVTAAMPSPEKLYFAVGSADLAADAKDKLAKFVDYAKANATSMVVLSGYHDPSGNKAQNEELALNRARAVRAALGDAGVAKERVEMSKPIETTGGGAPEEARRVEVSIKP